MAITSANREMPQSWFAGSQVVGNFKRQARYVPAQQVVEIVEIDLGELAIF